MKIQTKSHPEPTGYWVRHLKFRHSSGGITCSGSAGVVSHTKPGLAKAERRFWKHFTTLTPDPA